MYYYQLVMLYNSMHYYQLVHSIEVECNELYKPVDMFRHTFKPSSEQTHITLKNSQT
jgi:hypothetical protein